MRLAIRVYQLEGTPPNGAAASGWAPDGLSLTCGWKPAVIEIRSNTATKNPTEKAMRRFVIERDIPAIGQAEREQLREASQKSNAVLAELAPDIQWEHSYVTGDKIFCIYLAKDQNIIEEHARLSGFPATRITEVRKVIDPTTANPD